MLLGNKKNLNKYILAIVFMTVYFAVRVPFFKTGWDGSDANGLDTDIFVNHPQKPNYLLISRTDGKNNYIDAWGHPAPMYQMFSDMGYFFQKFENYNNLSDNQIIFRAKVISASFQFILFASLLLIFFRKDGDRILRKSLFIYFAIIFLSMVPIAINNSNEFQIDSLFGMLMVGFYMLVLVSGLFEFFSPGWFFGLLLISAAFVGLGKNEWSLLFVIALLAETFFIFALKLFFKRQDDYAFYLKIIAASFLGCILGNLGSYFFEPTLYRSGWDLLFAMSKGSSILSPEGVDKLIIMTSLRFIFIAPIILLILYNTYCIVKNIRKINFIILLCYFISIFFFFGFFFSTWGAFPRYFAPSFIANVITGSIIYFIYQKSYNKWEAMIYTIAVIFLFFQSIYYITDDNIKMQHIYGERNVDSIVKDKSCVSLLPVEDVYRKDVDFVHIQMGLEAATKIAAAHGKIICPSK